MLNAETKKKIDNARDILVGKIPVPMSQIEQITLALVYKFMSDIDESNTILGGKSFFEGEYAKYSWRNIMDKRLGAQERMNLYIEGIEFFKKSGTIPELFRNVFKDGFLPFRDPQTLDRFLKQINEFAYDHSEELGNAFEYLLSTAGSQGDAGQFRTPRHIIDFLVSVVEPTKDDTILDPACGTAGFLISAYKYILDQNTNKDGKIENKIELTKKLSKNITGYDISHDMVRLSLVNMYLHNFANPKIYEYDTLTNDDRWGEDYSCILANPPFMTPKGGIEPHNKFSIRASKSEVLFVDYIMEHLTSGGKAGVIVPEGVIFQSANAYKELRKKMIESNYLWGVVSLPSGVFQPYSGVKTSILLFDKNIAKRTDKIIFIKVEKDGFDLGAQRRETGISDLPNVKHDLKVFKDSVLHGNKESYLGWDKHLIVEKSKIAENGDYNLSMERYREAIVSNSNFEMVELGEVCEFIRGITFGKKDQLEENDNSNYVLIATTKASQSEGLVLKDLVKVKSSVIKNDKSYLKNGDLLISIANSSNLLGRKTFINNLDKNISVSFGAFMGCLRVLEGKILPKLLNYYLEQDTYKMFCLSRANTTTNISNLNWGDLQQFKIPLPPLEIQEQIVEELDSYQKIIDGAKQIVENYKPKIKIDESWEVVELGEVCEINPQKNEIKNLDDNLEITFLPMEDLNEKEMIFKTKKVKNKGEVYSGYTYFRDNDVLLAKVTPCFENGKSGIAKNLINGIGFGSSEYYVLRGKNSILSEWIYLNISSNDFLNNGKNNMSGTGGLKRLTKDFVKNFKIPLPPLEIQKQIIAKIEEEQKMVESNKKLIEIFEGKMKEKIGEVWSEE